MKYLFFFLFFSQPLFTFGWGFGAHQYITRMSVVLLPNEMKGFYKKNILELEERCLAPDKRRHSVKNEAPKHYIDFEAYGDSSAFKMPLQWDTAVAKYSEDTLMKYGIVPYHIHAVYKLLTDAFLAKDKEKVLYYSAEISHYISDSNVPLHTTINYDGQLTGQKGIHSLWETRLTTLYMHKYSFRLPKASFVEKPSNYIWKNLQNAHGFLPLVLSAEKEVTNKLGEESKYSIVERNGILEKNYSKTFCKQYHKSLNGMVEEQMRSSVKQIADFWFSAWVMAGQPDINQW